MKISKTAPTAPIFGSVAPKNLTPNPKIWGGWHVYLIQLNIWVNAPLFLVNFIPAPSLQIFEMNRHL